MNPVGKALWFIESHFAEEITLDEIAAIGGVSRYHLSRAFSVATGQPAMRHVRARRLREAARALAKKGQPIFSMSLSRRITALTKHSPARSAISSG